MIDSITYKPSGEPGDYGFWECPECKSQFSSGGGAIHSRDCSKKNRLGYEAYVGLTYYYTQAEIDTWEESYERNGYAAHLPLSPAGLSNYCC